MWKGARGGIFYAHADDEHMMLTHPHIWERMTMLWHILVALLAELE